MTTLARPLDPALLLFVRVSVALGGGYLAAVALRHSRAATRAALWSAVVVCLLILPLISSTLPERRVPLPILAERWLPDTRLPVALAAACYVIWLLGAVALLARFVLAWLAARRLVRDARELPDTEPV